MPGTYPTAPPGDTLAAIQQKVRRLTRSPSEAQLTTDDLNNYINTFVVYDFPEHLRTFNYRQQFSFFTNPFQDTYPTDILGFGGASQANLNPLYNFQNIYLTMHQPIYIAGYQSFFSQSREQFFGIYPIVNSIAAIGQTGDGVTTSFSGVVNINGAIINNNLTQNVCLLKNEVLFSSVDSLGNGLALRDSPILDSTTGNPTIFGLLYTPNNPPTTLPLLLTASGSPLSYMNDVNFPSTNYINYVTGQFVISFPFAPAPGALINSQTVPSITSLPQALLFYQNQFVVRPVPDQPYSVNFEVYVRPTQLLQTSSVPGLEEYWQYIAYGAARKIFQDRMDMESVALVDAEYKKQEALVLRRTIVQNTNERTATIYTEQVSGTGTSGWGCGNGGGSF